LSLPTFFQFFLIEKVDWDAQSALHPTTLLDLRKEGVELNIEQFLVNGIKASSLISNEPILTSAEKIKSTGNLEFGEL